MAPLRIRFAAAAVVAALAFLLPSEARAEEGADFQRPGAADSSDPKMDVEAPSPSPARPDVWFAHRFTLEARFGAGTPVGELGLVGTYALAPELSLGVGVGTGSGPNSANPHAAALLQLRPFFGVHNAVVVEGAFSTGAYERFEPLQGLMGEGGGVIESHYSNLANWMQLDVGWEYRTTGGFLIRVSSGFAWLLNPSSIRCSANDESTGAPLSTCQEPVTGSEVITTAQLALGHTL